ncbi:hypothetical protein [Inquilinus sp.]|jgi:hypothetical protein|uniref:hypothetical protein n=1 Tax=Inquilinus sp. TaxID=1932117 RepID=UPI0037833F8F
MRTILMLTALAGIGLPAGAAQAGGHGPDRISAPVAAADHAVPAVKPVAAEAKGGKGKGKG